MLLPISRVGQTRAAPPTSEWATSARVAQQRTRVLRRGPTRLRSNISRTVVDRSRDWQPKGFDERGPTPRSRADGRRPRDRRAPPPAEINAPGATSRVVMAKALGWRESAATMPTSARPQRSTAVRSGCAGRRRVLLINVIALVATGRHLRAIYNITSTTIPGLIRRILENLLEPIVAR